MAEELTPTELAAHLGISKRTLARIVMSERIGEYGYEVIRHSATDVRFKRKRTSTVTDQQTN